MGEYNNRLEFSGALNHFFNTEANGTHHIGSHKGFDMAFIEFFQAMDIIKIHQDMCTFF